MVCSTTPTIWLILSNRGRLFAANTIDSISDVKYDELLSSEQEIVVKGGSGRVHNETSRSKISIANKGKAPWNTGIKHSEETKQRIKDKTREAMIKKKEIEAEKLGLTLEQYLEQKKLEKKARAKAKRKGGLTDDGRKRISESLKRRWQDPQYRLNYTLYNFGNRKHSDETKARISESIKLKWQNETYRNIPRIVSDETRAKMSVSLKSKWEDPEFRIRMINQTYERTPEWKAKISEKIRWKWANDIVYREAVISGLKSVYNMTLNHTRIATRSRIPSNTTRVRVPRKPSIPKPKKLKKPPITTEDALKRRDEKISLRKEINYVRREAIKAAKLESLKENGLSIREVLGNDLWLEEKMRRKKVIGYFPDDKELEDLLKKEWKDQDTRAAKSSSNEQVEDDSDDSDSDGNDDNSVDYIDDFEEEVSEDIAYLNDYGYVMDDSSELSLFDEDEEDENNNSKEKKTKKKSTSKKSKSKKSVKSKVKNYDDDESSENEFDSLDLYDYDEEDGAEDLIEVYDEDGELVGRYNIEEFERMRNAKKNF
eukprot:gene6733-9227_t